MTRRDRQIVSKYGSHFPPRLTLVGYDSADIPGGVTQKDIRRGQPTPESNELMDNWVPENPKDVAISLILLIGWDDDEGADLFMSAIYTHEALARLREELRKPIDTRRCIAVHQYDWPKIKQSILDILAKCERDTWEASVAELRRYFTHEYE